MKKICLFLMLTQLGACAHLGMKIPRQTQAEKDKINAELVDKLELVADHFAPGAGTAARVLYEVSK